jgi:hypothetical protein
MTLYEKLVAAGCEIGNHESDLYVKCSQKAEMIILYHCLLPNSSLTYSQFRSNIDGSLWYDIPFAYDPFFNRPAIGLGVAFSIFDETLDDNDESDSEYDLLH